MLNATMMEATVVIIMNLDGTITVMFANVKIPMLLLQIVSIIGPMKNVKNGCNKENATKHGFEEIARRHVDFVDVLIFCQLLIVLQNKQNVNGLLFKKYARRLASFAKILIFPPTPNFSLH